MSTLTKLASLAQVVVDIPSRELASRSFTYRIPAYLEPFIQVGIQVLVPFGQKGLVKALVVEVQNHDQNLDMGYTLKDVVEVLDQTPLFNREYLDFLNWVSNYYMCSLASVIAAAGAAGLSGKVSKRIRLNEEFYQQALTTNTLDKAENLICKELNLSAQKELAVRALQQKCKLKATAFYRTIYKLSDSGLISVGSEISQSPQHKFKTMVNKKEQSSPPTQIQKRHLEILELLEEEGGILELSQLIELSSSSRTTLAKMEELGLVSIYKEKALRDPLANTLQNTKVLPESDWPKLRPQQEQVVDTLIKAPKSGQPWLLHGVTGSGKTEIYLRLIADTINRNKSALLLVPEISLTPQLAQRLVSRFGSNVGVWHSGLSAGEKYDTWRRIAQGEIKVLLGARSAILVPLANIGLIILDEEHDASYKQASPNPRYHTKILAQEKARRHEALVLYGSATPDVVTYFEAKDSQQLVELPERIHRQPMPKVTVVDMRQEFSAGNRSIFSKVLKQKIDQTLLDGKQIILLMNRRGYASHVFCRACGHTVECRNCSVTMVAHRTNATNRRSNTEKALGYLACHHCGFTCPFTQTCPACQSPFLKEYGLGTQKVEEELKTLYPEKRILRLDSDITARKGAYESVFNDFANGEGDILIGTQMVAKGLDISGVTLVGILSADAAFTMPDHRALERGFQLLTQVSGRAGRGEHPGQVVLQTYNPEMPVLAMAKEHDYKTFAEQEIISRQELDYPPFSQITRLVFSGAEGQRVESFADEAAEQLSRFLEDEISPQSIQLLGPAPCLIEKIKGQFRYQLIIKNLAGGQGLELIRKFIGKLRLPSGVNMNTDIDALDFI